ncbi:MAG TPA: tetratricopeptide repeat protein [Polyangia bacterium]
MRGAEGGTDPDLKFFLAELVLATLVLLAAPSAALAASEPASVDRLYSEWRFGEADRALAALIKVHPDEPGTLLAKGYERFMAGDFRAAVAEYKAAIGSSVVPPALKEMLTLAEGSAKVVDGYLERRSTHFVFRFPVEDAVLADYGLETLEAAATALAGDLGFAPSRPIPVDILRNSGDLATMTTLTEDEIERTGTVAVSKWSRIMLTSPRAMRLGYEWQDSLSHEFIHYVVAALTRDRAPVWLQEGFAKFLEHRWRMPAGLSLNPSMQHFLAKALANGKLIPFDAMHPSMAKLPRAEDATLAFAEVTTAVACLFTKAGSAALREVLVTVRDGGDARVAVARAYGGTGTWPEFERAWRQFMVGLHYKTLPGLEPLVRKYKKKGVSSASALNEDDATSTAGEAGRFLRLGNMMLLRNRPRAASVEYEKGYKIAGNSHWIFPVKLGRTYLALGESEQALKAVGGVEATYPELPWPHLIAGQAALAKGDAKAAVAALSLSLAINPYDPSVHCSLAQAYKQLPDAPPDKRQRAERDCRELGK